MSGRTRGIRTSGQHSTLPSLFLAAALLSLTGVAAGLSAQSVRGWAGTNVQMVELRPIALDTLPIAAVFQSEDGAFTFDGLPVACTALGFCTGYVARGKQRSWAATEDLSFTAWGFGVEGLSFTGLLRGRARFGSDAVWPRSDDEIDVMLGYAQWVRGSVRARLGRQELRTGLGFPAFDGAWLAYSLGAADAQAYGGRSLARGLREPAHEALRGLESFLPDESAYLVGGSLHVRSFGTDVTARYHREILADNSSLVSERGSVDVSSVLPGWRVNGSLDYDFGHGRVGKGHLTVALPLQDGGWLLEGTARRYVPYFELSTIWGFFQPVEYSEFELRSSWAWTGDVGVWAAASLRSYGDADVTTVFRPLEDTGWRGRAGVRWTPRPEWTMESEYRIEWLPGGFLNSLDASARWAISDRLSVTGQLMTFQHIEEFSVGDGRAYGGGGTVDFAYSDRLTFAGGASLLRHRDGGTALDSPWNQARAWSSLRVAIGGDPGLAARRNR